MYKAIVFDLDGTLVDSPLCFKSIKEKLEIPQDEFILEYLERLVHPLKAEKLRILQEIEVHAAKKSMPFPGALDVLKELRGLNIKTGIFTRNCRAATEHVIGAFDLKVDRILTREDALPKPNPEGILRFLTEWSLQSHELLFVGDFRFDIECGKKAGVKTALFTNGRVGLEDLEPDHLISHYSSFFECVPLKTLL